MYLKKASKFIVIFFVFFLIVFLTFFTFYSKFRRSILTYIFVTHDFYRIKNLTYDVQNRNFDGASKKLIKYINISKKFAKDSGYMVNGIYDAVELVANRAVFQVDYNHLEKVFEELVKMEPASYKPNVWLAIALKDNDLNRSIKLLKKAIALSPAQEDAYREIIKIIQSTNNENIKNEYCDLYKSSMKNYSKSQLGGLKSSHFSNFFISNNLRNFGLTFINTKNDNTYYVNPGIIIDKFQAYEFIPKESLNINGINLYFSFLTGVNIKVKEIELFSDENKILIPIKNISTTSNNSYFMNEKDYISIILLKLTDEVVQFKFNTGFSKINKINIIMDFNKLNLSSNLNCLND